MFWIAINKLFEWLRAGFVSRPGYVSPGTSSLGWRWPWSSLFEALKKTFPSTVLWFLNTFFYLRRLMVMHIKQVIIYLRSLSLPGLIRKRRQASASFVALPSAKGRRLASWPPDAPSLHRPTSARTAHTSQHWHQERTMLLTVYLA